jgi:ABC-2 type transport system ATP-binding protein
LFSSHVLAEVERVCDRVGILQRGRLVHLQHIAELREGRYVRGRFANTPAQGPDGSPAVALSNGEIEFHYRGPLPALLEWLAGQQVSDLRIEPPGLAPIYHRFHGASS